MSRINGKMMKFLTPRQITFNIKWILIAMIVILSSCVSNAHTSTDTDINTTPTQFSPDIQASPTPTPDSSGDGISFSEMRESTPLAPLDLQANLSSQGVQLTWIPAPPGDFSHSYSDTILYYNIYRRPKNGKELLLLDTSTNPFYIDNDVISGEIYYYAVSAVHQGEVEGLKSDEITWSQP